MSVESEAMTSLSTQEVIAVLMSITAIASYINFRFIKLPKSIGITLVTLILSIVIILIGRGNLDFAGHVETFAHDVLNGIHFKETFLQFILSFLLFAGALHVNIIDLAKQKAVIAALATFGVVMSTFLVGYATWGLNLFLGLDIPLMYCFVFGALISPTDPIAVLGILKRVKVPKALEIKITGEALFNDGIAIMLFMLFAELAGGTSAKTLTSEWVIHFFAKQAVGGILAGCFVGWIAGIFLRKVDDYEVAIIITLAIVTAGYTFAHSILDVSGPITMAVAGLIVGGMLRKGEMSQYTIEKLDGFWDLLDEVLNAILFVLIGLEFLRLTLSLQVLYASVGVVAISIAARWISVAVPVACLSIFKKFSKHVILLMTWGGLRGGISIALALSFPAKGIDPARDVLIAITYAVVIFSILVQGLTISSLLKKIKKEGSLEEEDRAFFEMTS